VRTIFVTALLLASLVAPSTPAQLSSDQQKLVNLYSKTLARSRDVAERRDAARGLGTINAPEVVPPLTEALADSDPTVRRQAADALWRVSEFAESATDALRGRLDDPSPGVRVRAAAALEALGVPDAELVDARRAGLEAELLRDRILAARDLVGFLPGSKLVPPIAEVAAAEADTRQYDLGDAYLDPVKVLESLGRTGETSFVQPVMVEVRAGNPGRRWLLEGIASVEPKPDDWNEVLMAQLASPRTEDRQVGLRLLRERETEAEGVEDWIGAVSSALDDTTVRADAILTLASARGHAASAGARLARIVASEGDAELREKAAQALAAIGDRGQAFPSDVLREVAVEVLPVLCTAAVEDSDEGVRGAALQALDTLRVSADEVLPTFLAAAGNDPRDHNRFKALQYIRDLGTDAQSAVLELEKIIATDPSNRAMAEQALEFVTSRPPDFSLDVSTAAADATASDGALRSLRAEGAEYSLHEFYLALSRSDSDRVKLFLDAGMSPDERVDEVGMRPLHVLYFHQAGCSLQVRPTPESTKAITRLLLERGADPDAVDDRGNSVLKMAAMACDAEIVRLLVAAGADVNATDPSGMAPFELTLWSGTDAAGALLEAGYRLPEDKAASYREAYADNPKALELIDKATTR
jgi:HEAT repeat protein